jgi:hypothetical protein
MVADSSKRYLNALIVYRKFDIEGTFFNATQLNNAITIVKTQKVRKKSIFSNKDVSTNYSENRVQISESVYDNFTDVAF